MCGICGVYGFEDKNLVKEMCNVIYHRGPDDSGTFFDKDIGLGNQRLSIIDLESGHQPIHNEDESIWIVYNGETYNYLRLKQELEEKGHRFYTLTDTEVLVHLYEEEGDLFVKKIRGIFTIALWDGNEKKLLLARDSRGIKPLYYTTIDENLIFGSEIKSILKCDGVGRKVNLRSLDEFLTYRVIMNQGTLFEGIEKLLPGCILTIKNGSKSIRKYHDFRQWQVDKGDDVAIATKVRTFLKDSIKARLMSDVPLGVFLSGGLDSSSIVALMSELVEEPTKTFTVGFDEKTDEFEYARIISDFFETDHRELIVNYEDMTTKFPTMIWHMDEPIADPALVPFYFASKLAKENVKVALVGEGSDELFAGYLHHKIATRYLNMIPIEIKKRIYIRLNNIFSYKDIRKLLRQDNIQDGETRDNHRKKLESFDNTRMESFLNKILLWELKNVLPNFQLMRVDKMAMAHSLEARVPFLDQDLIDFSYTIPNNLKLNGLKGKVILRKALYNKLPESTSRGKKRIFSVPLDRWFEEGLREVAYSALDDSKLVKNRIFSGKYIDDLLKKQKNSFKKRRYSYRLWTVLMVELWYRVFIEGKVDRKPELSINNLF